MKNTLILHINETNIEEALLSQAAEAIKQKKTVILPTETVYGLGANALSSEAVEKIFIAKGRPQDNPLIVHISNMEMLEKCVNAIPEAALSLMHTFWPGPLTLILEKSSLIPSNVSAGLNTVGVRMPDHPIALKLIEFANTPIAAPSANRSGRPSPTTAQHVISDMQGRVDVIIAADHSRIGLESTVLDMTHNPPMILRPGGVTLSQLQMIIPEITIDPQVHHSVDSPRSPGMKYTHYAPQAEMIMVRGDHSKVLKKITQLMDEHKHLKCAIICADEHLQDYRGQHCLSLGSLANPAFMASQLFTVLRQCDELNLDYVITEAFVEEEMGLALMNRLKKAVGYNILDV